jgi:opacity protein-like surface antigen
MKTLKFISIVIFFFLSGFVTEMFSQSKTGTTIGQFLKIEPSSRAAAMGNAGTSISGEAASIFYNPASLGRLSSIDVQFTYNKWVADILYNYAIAAVPLGEIGTFALQVTSLNSGEIDVRTVEQPLGTGERYKVTNFALGIGYGLMLTDRVSVGTQISYFQETIWHSTLTGFAMNFGVSYEYESFSIGASVSNFGPRAGYEGRDLYINYDFDPKKYGDNDMLPAELRTDSYPLPTVFRVGVSYPFVFSEDYKLTIAIDAMHPNDNTEKVNVGAEFQLLQNIAIRGGYRDLFVPDSEGGLVLGVGVNVPFAGNSNVRFDYAWADYGRLLETHRFTIGVALF